MTSVHHQRRFSGENDHVSWTKAKWDNIIWSDENNFNLKGPDLMHVTGQIVVFAGEFFKIDALEEVES